MLELCKSPFFGVALSIVAFWIGERIHKKTGLSICNPIIIAIVLIIGVLLIFRIPYSYYQEGGALIDLFLAPATACLAVSIYTKLQLLKENWLPILIGCAMGSLASMASIFGMCRLLGLDEQLTASLLPKSVTIVAVIFTGILGSVFAPLLIRLFRVKEPLEAGTAIGACSHAVGTSKAVELGETEGAMSGLAIGVCGIMTVLFSMFL